MTHERWMELFWKQRAPLNDRAVMFSTYGMMMTDRNKHEEAQDAFLLARILKEWHLEEFRVKPGAWLYR